MKALNNAIKLLLHGQPVALGLRGNSMTPMIKDDQLVTIYPIDDPKELKVGQAVLCKVRKRILLHLVTALEKNRVQIGNNHGHINGWTHRDNIYGIVRGIHDKKSKPKEKKKDASRDNSKANNPASGKSDWHARDLL